MLDDAAFCQGVEDAEEEDIYGSVGQPAQTAQEDIYGGVGQPNQDYQEEDEEDLYNDIVPGLAQVDGVSRPTPLAFHASFSKPA